MNDRAGEGRGECLPATHGHAPPLACGRLLRFPDESSRCPGEATHHVMWDEDGNNGLVCERHRLEAVTKWSPFAVHAYEMTCSMPGAVFIHAENRCVVDEGLLGLGVEQEEVAHV